MFTWATDLQLTKKIEFRSISTNKKWCRFQITIQNLKFALQNQNPPVSSQRINNLLNSSKESNCTQQRRIVLRSPTTLRFSKTYTGCENNSKTSNPNNRTAASPLLTRDDIRIKTPNFSSSYPQKCSKEASKVKDHSSARDNQWLQWPSRDKNFTLSLTTPNNRIRKKKEIALDI